MTDSFARAYLVHVRPVVLLMSSMSHGKDKLIIRTMEKILLVKEMT